MPRRKAKPAKLQPLRSLGDLEDLARRIDMYERADREALAATFPEMRTRLEANHRELEAAEWAAPVVARTSAPIARGRHGDLEIVN